MRWCISAHSIDNLHRISINRACSGIWHPEKNWKYQNVLFSSVSEWSQSLATQWWTCIYPCPAYQFVVLLHRQQLWPEASFLHMLHKHPLGLKLTCNFKTSLKCIAVTQFKVGIQFSIQPHGSVLTFDILSLYYLQSNVGFRWIGNHWKVFVFTFYTLSQHFWKLGFEWKPVSVAVFNYKNEKKKFITVNKWIKGIQCWCPRCLAVSECSPSLLNIKPCAAVVLVCLWMALRCVHCDPLESQLCWFGVSIVSVDVCLCRCIRIHVNTFVSVVCAASLSFWWELNTFNYAAGSLAL